PSRVKGRSFCHRFFVTARKVQTLRVVFILLLFFLLSACSSSGTTHRVSIQGMNFVPPTIEVRVGDKIAWTNEDLVPHTVTAQGASDHEKAFDSGVLSPNKTFEYRVKAAGETPYACTLHPTMTGKIIVKGQ